MKKKTRYLGILKSELNQRSHNDLPDLYSMNCFGVNHHYRTLGFHHNIAK